MEALPDYVRDTVAHPDLTADSASDPETVVLYQRHFPGLALGNGWVRVVVKYLKDDAFVLTAFVSGPNSRVDSG